MTWDPGSAIPEDGILKKARIFGLRMIKPTKTHPTEWGVEKGHRHQSGQDSQSQMASSATKKITNITNKARGVHSTLFTID